MAEEEEKKGAGGRGDKEEEEIPFGFRFEPKENELVEYYLLPRLQCRPTVPNHRIIETNVYEFHPDKLINELYNDRGEDTWYFLSPRARKFQGTEDDHGRWKASTGRSQKRQSTAGGSSPARIPLPTTRAQSRLDKFVMCKIYVSSRDRSGDEENAEASTSNAAFDEEHSSSQPGPQASASIASSDGEFSSPQLGSPVRTSEETSGNKRPAEEHAAVAQRPPQQRKLTTGAAPAPPPASSYIGGAGAGGGMQMPLRTAIHDNRAGHTMARPLGHATVPPPRQHATVNGPMRMPNGQVVYSDQLMMRRQMATAAYKRQMFLQQLAARNGQAPVQGVVVADNGQGASPVQRPPAACNGQAPFAQGSQVASNGQMSPIQRQRAAKAAAYNNYQYHQMLLQQQQQAAMAYNLQAQLQGREVAHNGKTTSAQQPPARHNCQMMPAHGPEVEQNGETTSSAQRAPAACNCPALVQQPQARPFNVPPMPLRPRPAASTSGNSFSRTLVMRRSPSTSVQPPPQQRPAPETPEMHAKRVLGQLVKELFCQRRIDQAQAAQERLMLMPQQPCSDAVRCNDDGEMHSAGVATTEVAPDGSASAEGNDLQRDSPSPVAPQTE